MTSGGKRIGAGRKEKDPRHRRVQMMITIHPATRESLKAQARTQGITPGRLIDQMFNNDEEKRDI